ncbi:MAG: carboxypeptidase-like regulatory domain-containing protein, partial [Tenuifilaceae bacterium]|nr:carboxypeptidase-like regulatory domain-containing protein [Tenuifilaceae bacterium]
MKRLCVFLAGLVLVGISFAQAQTVRITGTVTSSEDGMPIPGVSVVVKGTTIGGITDPDGKYGLNVPSDAQTLIYSFVGLKTQEVAIGGRAIIDVVMEPEMLQVEEVVVTALGITRQKKALGYAVQDVKGDELNKAGQTNVLNALTGKIAGVQISGASGNTGGSAKILIRGVASVSGSNDPLFII